MLVLLLFIHVASGEANQLEPLFRTVSSCPDKGYFLSSEPGENLTGDQCYLCFCKGVAAVCWKHQNRRCDIKSYVHDSRIRQRRSPGFADLFFQDAARDMFKKQTPEECKPFQSSHSVGCPPVDWCIGCTVCDCNANGRWDCHVLSFCPGDKSKKKAKKKRTAINAMKPNRNATPTPKPTTKRTLPTNLTLKRTTPKRPTRRYVTVQSKMKGTASTKPTSRKNMPKQSKTQGPKLTKPTTRKTITTKPTNITNMPTKPTSRRIIPRKKKTVPAKPTVNKTIQIKPAVKRTMDKKPALKKTTDSKPAVKRAATKILVNNTTVQKLNKVHQINAAKPQNVNETKIKTNQMMRINTKPRKDISKENSTPPKKTINLAKPVQKKTVTAKLKPALRNVQKVTGKPTKHVNEKSKTVRKTTVPVHNISSKVMKSTEKIINENQKKLSKLINYKDEKQPTNVITNNFKSMPEKNIAIIEMNNKMKQKVISNKNNVVTPKKLSRKKRFHEE